jgi:hypothetical protein
VRELGWPIAAEAMEFTTEGVIEATVTLTAQAQPASA